MPRRAFTLVELLVVIAIMVTLMSLIMGGVMLAKRVAMRGKAVSLLGAVASAIDQYRSLNNTYPESWMVTASPPALWASDVQAKSTWLQGLADGDDVYKKAFESGLPSDDAVWEGVNRHLVYQLGDLIREQAPTGQTLDPWKKPLRFRPSKWYKYALALTPRIDCENPPGADSYQLWSAGPNATDAPGNPGEGDDDIPQWAKLP